VLLFLTFGVSNNLHSIHNLTDLIPPSPNISEVFQKRKFHLQKVCSEYENQFFRPEYFSLFGSDAQELNSLTHYFKWKGKEYLFLSSYKCGSNSWVRLFGGLDPNISYRCSNCTRSTIHKIMFNARHPLERLLSAYRHLFEEEGWRLFVTNNELRSGVSEYLESNNVSWTTFIEDVVLSNSLNRGFELDVMYKGFKKVIFEPTLLTHWAPYWFTHRLCSPNFSPDIILKMETVEQDFENLKTFLEIGQDVKLDRVFVKGDLKPSGEHSSNLLKKYFSQLSKKKILDLYEMYKLDHRLFDYSPDKILQYGYS